MEENKITFENIQKANDTIKTTGIERRDKDGNLVVKNYAEVNQRIKAFRMVYPTGTIETEMISNKDGVVIFSARVYGEPKQVKNVQYDGYLEVDTFQRGELLGTGTAYEKENSTFINKTSYIENCETSAVGRALGMAGFGIDTSVASAEEVQNAIANQEEPKATEKQIEILEKYYTGDNLDKLLFKNSITDIKDLPIKKASELISELMKKQEK